MGVVDLIRPGQAGTWGVEAKISGTRVTMKIIILSLLITLVVSQSTRQEPPPGQRCSGRNYNGRRGCTPEQLPVREEPVIVPGTPLEPPAGQRCRGRNYDG